MVGHYFEKRRALATGIVACGTGVGMFLGPTLSVTLVNCYQWQGALWVTSGIVLHTAVYGALYRPLTGKEKEPQNSKLMDWNLFKNRDFIIITLSQFLIVLGKYGSTKIKRIAYLVLYTSFTYRIVAKGVAGTG